MKKVVSKQDWVLGQLQRGRTLTPLVAFDGCGTMRLAAIIHELRFSHNIETIPMHRSNGVNYAAYKMIRKGKKA